MTCDLRRITDGDTLTVDEQNRLMALVEVERERREATQRNFGNMTESARAWQSEAVLGSTGEQRWLTA